MALLSKIIFAAAIATAKAQSSDPGIGSNPNAQGATEEVTPGSGPNGSEDWFNTGLNSGGWNPPFLDFTSLYHINRPQFYSGVGAACAQYDSYFQSAGDSHGIDPTILAFIAMQESSCNADAGGPTPGLMQVACENYPNGVCTDSLQDNVDAGANYLSSQLQATGNNAIAAIGAYNGWFPGMTQDYPCSAQGQANGEPQNLDYLQQTLNGWFTGQDVYGDETWIGDYQCSGNCDNGNLC
ncbi:glycoside hydrolase family 23 protein [Hyaloscypha hepaticicola]|uniref:Glycoside hydrolase family 23 protein n=1 Tax=Hyaloscypha hepaticicola TaxID=2082293 RepID=A0A2J6PQI9_9HELO|nr:glycoside hydrolase family 23 protein [Hyaloscypha hepaticicola]